MTSLLYRRLMTVWLLTALPATAFAQGAIVGGVTDSSGAVLRGVLVEVTSPVLIERTRTTHTDDAGRYRVDGLRPGRYLVRFTTVGLQPAQRDDVEVAGSFTAIVNAELSPGGFAESVRVTANGPPVDIHIATGEVTVPGEVVRSLPTARSYNALVVIVPGVVTNVNDTVTGTATTSFPRHGGRLNEGRLLLDGLTVGSPPSGNSATSYVVDVGLAQEVTFVTAGASGESETGGLVMNILPRIGGITMRDVIADDVISTIETVSRRSKTVARRAFDMISLIFSYALAKRAAPQNPCIGLEASAIIGEHQKRARLKLEGPGRGLWPYPTRTRR